MGHTMRTCVCLAAVLAAAPAWAGERVVTMAGSEYRPAELRARIGERIRFVNDDETAHNVFVPTVGHAVDLGRQDPGQEAVLELGKAGVFEVECVFHPHMVMTVEVAPPERGP